MAALQEVRARNQGSLGRAQALGDQQRVFIPQLANTQRHVDAFGHQIDAAVDQGHFQLNLRMRGEKSSDHIRHDVLCQPHRARHPQPATGLAGHAGHGLIGHLGFQQHCLAVAQVALADGGEGQLARGALQQAGAQAFFQLGNPPRQPRLGNAQQPTSGRETAGFDDFGEIVEIVEVLHGAPIVLSVGQTIALQAAYRVLVSCVASPPSDRHCRSHLGDPS